MKVEPGRVLITRSPHRRVGYVNCGWFQRDSIQYESLLERSFIEIALLCPTVRAIQFQPFTIRAPELRKYTPDFLLRCDHGITLVVEVKPLALLPKHCEKLRTAKKLIESLGHKFIVCTDESIHGGGRSARASKILRYAIAHEDLAIVRESIEKLQRTLPASLDKIAQDCNVEPHLILCLIARRELMLQPDLTLEMVFTPATYREAQDEHVSTVSWLGHQTL